MSDTNTGQVEKEGFGVFLRDLWTITKPYFTSEEKWSAWGLFALVLGLSLLLVQINVELSYWRNDFYTALQHKQWSTFINLITTWQPVPKGHHGAIFGVMPGFTPMVILYIPVAIYATYVTQWLQIRWRRWMTEVWLDRWLSDRTQYHLAIMPPGPKGPDNPDQRLAEDLRDGINFTISLVIDFIKNGLSLIQFVFILGAISGPLMLLGVRIPAYLLWVALIYAIIGTFITHKVGNPLAFLRNYQQTCEANFRFGLARVREYAEAIALYLGERDEKEDLLGRFKTLMGNWEEIMLRTKKLNALTSSYAQAAVIFPYLVAAPRYFFGPLELGDLMQIAGAFGEVQTALSWFVSSYADLANWRAIVSRLASFARAMEAAREMDGEAIVVKDGSVDAVKVSDLTLQLPNGTTLLAHESFEIAAGTSMVITGASGSGKSTLFRAIAGIWPYAHGLVQRSVGESMFLPQRPYIPLGTLRRVVTYPGIRKYDDADIKQALLDVGLGHLVDKLDKVDHWPTALSGGEQQRVAVARALLQRPGWLFLDEATASLDPEGETRVYETIGTRLPNTTIVSIAHRESVKRFHKVQLELKRGAEGEPGRLVRTVL